MQKDSIPKPRAGPGPPSTRPSAGRPAPELAARDLRAALLANRSGVVRSGSFFQATVAPLLARIAPRSWVRWATARYYGL
jgi:hypothetical protein